MTGERRLENAGRERAPRGLAETHAEIEQRRLIKPAQNFAMRPLSGGVSGQTMIQRMRLGEASGGALAAGILKAALACNSGMSTFAEAGVANKA